MQKCALQRSHCILNNLLEKLLLSEYLIKDVFEEAADTSRTKKGFGFLLFLARQLISKNGGQFYLSSTEASGAELRINFKSTSSQPS